MKPKGPFTMPTCVIELELWSPPRMSAVALNGKEVAKRCRQETGLPEGVVLGLNSFPDPIDVQNLRDALSTGEARAAEFFEFCSEQGLEQNPENERSAYEYLGFAQGRPLAWLHIPAAETGLEMVRTIIGWASRNGFQLHDGARTYEPLTEAQVYALWQ